MTSREDPPFSTRNHLLASLPVEELHLLQPHLELIDFPLRQTVFSPGDPVTTVIFPETGWVSMLATLEDGDSAEIGFVGREGMVGISVLLEVERTSTEAMWQAGGTALRLPARVLREAMERSSDVRRPIFRYAMAFHGQVAQTAACNGRHGIDQRLARWMLMAHDRADGDGFPMTHEFLAMMLGVRRASVTVAAGMLQKAGFIRYGGGRMTLTDRPGLEAAACECYGTVRREYLRLTGFAGRGDPPEPA